METFKPETFHSLLQESYDTSTGAINATLFLEALSGVPLLFNSIGGALKAGNGALADKIGIVTQRLKETATDLGTEESLLSLQDIIERDIKNKWTHSGKKKRHATRNIIRLVWFLDFIAALFVKLVDSKYTSTREVLLACWRETLGPRQRTMINMSTIGALKVATPPSHTELFKLFKVDEKTEEERNGMLTQWSRDINSLAGNLWSFFKEKKIENVP